MPIKSLRLDPRGETPEYHGPVSSYEVVESQPESSDDRFIAAEMYQEEGAASEAQIAEPAQVSFAPVRVEEPREKAGVTARQMKFYAFLGTGLGLVAAFSVVLWLLPGGRSDSWYDMGKPTAGTSGLKAQLSTRLQNDHLSYKFILQPVSAAQLAGFQNAVSSSRQPLSVEIQLKDPLGAVLCGNTILVRFDPLKNGAATPVSPLKNAKAAAAALNRAQVEQALNNARLEGQELTREHGKDLFENVAGKDGQLASLSAQGALPCTAKQYRNTASWAFVSNFPVAGASSQGTANAPAADESADKNARAASEAALRKHKAAAPISHFSIEEDDALVGYQSSTGTIETRAGRTLLVEKKDELTASLKGADLPVPIHYRCDQFGVCTLAGVKLSPQRAWLQR
jgi:hypothetical protein